MKESESQEWLFEIAELDRINGIKPDYSYLPRFPNPKNENQKLLEAQAKWVIDRDEKSWEYIWLRAMTIAKKIIRKKYADRLRGDLEDRAISAVEYVLRRYTKRPGWCVKKNFSAAIYNGCQHAMDYCTKADRIVDFVDFDKLNLVLEFGDEKQN